MSQDDTCDANKRVELMLETNYRELIKTKEQNCNENVS